MKILSIGNSFSVDSQRYVKDIANSLGSDVTLGNLYIGGCSLERHCQNMISGLPAYEYFFNNKSLGSASLLTGLKDENWDIITLQQASHFSGDESTYFPYIERLSDYVRKTVDKAQIYVNQTWAYEYNSAHSGFAFYGNDRFRMHEMLSACYDKAASAIGAKLIKVGSAVARAREDAAFDPEKGGIALTRDGFHLSYNYGRLLAGYVWCRTLLGLDVGRSDFRPADHEYIGRDKNTGAPVYREIPGTHADEAKVKLLMNYSV